MLFGLCLGLLMATGLYGFLLWLCLRRIADSLKTDLQAADFFSRHVLVALFGRRESEDCPPTNNKPAPLRACQRAPPDSGPAANSCP